MEDILDFLFDNPIFLILILYWVFSSVFGKKKQQQKQEEKAVRQAAKEAAQSERKNRFREAVNRLEQAVEAAEQQFEGTKPVEPAKIGPPQPLPPSGVVQKTEAANDPFAFHSVMEPGNRTTLASEAVDYDITAKDYDLTAQDYDLTTEDYDTRIEIPGSITPAVRQGGTGYHSVGGFQEFHIAHGLSQQERTGVTAIQAIEVETGHEGGELPFAISNPDEIRKAIILQEILGKPKGLRPQGSAR